MKNARRRPKGKALPPTHGNRIDAKLARAVVASELSPHAIAAKAGVDHRSLGRFLSGERSLSLAVAAAVAEALGLDLVERKPRPRGATPAPADAGGGGAS